MITTIRMQEGCVCVTARRATYWCACVSGNVRACNSNLECQLGHTYPLLLLASFLFSVLLFQHFTSLLLPALKPMRARVHSKKRSEPFLQLFSANHPPSPPPLCSLFFHFSITFSDLLFFLPYLEKEDAVYTQKHA